MSQNGYATCADTERTMPVDVADLHSLFHASYKRANPGISEDRCEDEANAIWQSLESDHQLETRASEFVRLWDAKANSIKQGQFAFRDKATTSASPFHSLTAFPDVEISCCSSLTSAKSTPAQDSLKAQIALQEARVEVLIAKKESDPQEGPLRELIDAQAELNRLKRELKRKQADVERARKLRKRRKQEMAVIREQHPDLAKRMKLRDRPGQPSLEDNQPGILETIKMITEQAGDSESGDSPCSLSMLQKKLELQGFSISRSATYLRILSLRSSKTQGKLNAHVRHTISACDEVVVC